MNRFWKILYPEYRYFDGNRELKRRVEITAMSKGFGVRRQMVVMLLFFGIPFYTLSMGTFIYLQRNPILWPGVDPWLLNLGSLLVCAGIMFFTRKIARRNLRRALIRCNVPVCIGCGYDLANTDASQPCPECGAPYPQLGEPTASQPEPESA